ncbi:hypothetical protein [Edaphocola flava]|uniref:hypothetical protein n=1 Tax=Edaphocola flava TaxID=2499629 RepID=UPI00100BF758|nr:hypothetical protein [Edaphocola flava]
MRYNSIIVFAALFLSSCATKLYVPLEQVHLTNQKEAFILGTNELPVILESASLNPKDNMYTINGYVDFTMAPDRNYARHPNIEIKIISNGDTTHLTKTRKWGKFQIKMRNVDTAYFNYEQWKIITVD